ncbi:lebercilin isoform X2 [Sphaeramia orbicularis]|uniref:Lebercilin domain-containing protein n=1 Tax=Sphaeramia orbicularis TaxID=375764 RepID=A0A673B5P4_9TELE|nr:lebercilin isoform X2 [Sphaeramia orbicularis]
MESENTTHQFEDNRDVHLSRQSLQSTKTDSRASSSQKQICNKNSNDKIRDEEEKEDYVESRSKTRIWHPDPDRDQISDDGRKSAGSFYSDDYENESPSERSLSPYSRSRTPSPIPKRSVRGKRNSTSPLYKTGGVVRRGAPRPQRPGGQHMPQQHRRGVRSQSKESLPPKDLDLVTKRMLSARLLKINELRNALVELQQRTDELQKENRILRQLQVRQEKALQRYDDTESEISQLISRHSNETHVLRERLRRTQERERAVERRLKDSEEQLQRSKATIVRLKKLVDQRELGARDELSRKLDEERARGQEAEHKIKELERSMELSTGSFHRQLAAEKKKTISAQEEIRTLQEELGQMTNKLKEKERELDAKNIYANRMAKPPQRRDADTGIKRKVSSRNSTKAVQTEARTSSPDFPTPPPAITDGNEYSESAPDDYLSLKEFDRVGQHSEINDRHQDQEQQKMTDREQGQGSAFVKEKDCERRQPQQLNQELNVFEEKTKKQRNQSEKEKDDDRSRRSSLFNQKEEEKITKRSHVQEEVERWNQEALANQQTADEARRKKEHLLAKMREIDRQNQAVQDTIFDVTSPTNNSSGQRNPATSIFSLTATEETASSLGVTDSREYGRRRPDVESGGVTTGMGRRAVRSQNSTDSMAFGAYAPSFGLSASRGTSSFSPTPPKEDRDSALEAIGIFSLRKMDTEKEKETERAGAKGRKSSLMHQLFGTLATPAGDMNTSNKMEMLSSPPPTNGVRSRREGLNSFNSGPSTPPASSINTLHVADSKPAICAITSFDEDIEELTL